MKGTSVFLDRIAGRKAAARVIDGQLDDFLIDPPEGSVPTAGTLFRGSVERPMKGQGGVFVRLPEGKGFLRQAKGLAQGESVLVQVTGYAEPGKATPITQRILFKSRFAIVTPGAPGLNVSRSIRDEEIRAKLRFLAEDVMDGSDFGLVLRSLAENADEDDIAEDIAEMRALAEHVTAAATGAPEHLLAGSDAHTTAWREWGDPDEIVTDSGCFADRGVLDDLARLTGFQVSLPGGGSIVVEPTRALIAVDVNTGSDQSPAACLKANIDAARALPRLLRLRGLGGQITVDFAPLVKKDRRQVEQVLRNSFKACPVETALVGWTPLGHYELQRKRERFPLDAATIEAIA